MTLHAQPFGFAAGGLEDAVAALRERFGDQAATGRSVRALHARDESHHEASPPALVVFPQSSEEVAEVLNIAARFRVSVTPWGAGSGLEGGAIPEARGITLSLARFDRIAAVRPDDMIAVVGAGVRRKALNRELRATGLFFPVDPGADASLGGMAATGASGTNAVRYGTMRENVLALTVVTAAGAIVRTGSLAPKSSSGYDLTRLFVGSEGTLGIITEVALRLHPILPAATAVAAFATLAGAVETVTDIKRMGLGIGRVELLDAETVAVANREAERVGAPALEPLPTLLFEFQGEIAQADGVAEAVAAIAAEHGGTSFRWLRDPSEASALWDMRRDVMGWARHERAGSGSWPTDTCVPVSALAQSVLAARADIEASGVPGYIIGHVGDGNFHCVFTLLPGEEAKVQAAAARIARRALAVGGTATGEHGVGLGKRGFLVEEHGAPAVALMRTLKAALDPLGILNPGKVLPDPS